MNLIDALARERIVTEAVAPYRRESQRLETELAGLRQEVCQLRSKLADVRAELRLTHQLAEDREQQAEEYRCLYDNARAWARLWKRAAIVNRFDREHRQWLVWRYELYQGVLRFPMVRYAAMIRRALGLPAAPATNAGPPGEGDA